MKKLCRRAVAFAVAALSAGAATSAHAEFKAEVKYAQVGDIKMAYYTRGKGDPLIMIMGYTSTMGAWDPALLDALDDNNTLILFDNRGVGLSTDTTRNNTTFAQMADDTAGLLKALGHEKANVLGWSMGARIAQQVVIRHPDQVMKAIFAAPNPGGNKQVPAKASIAKELNDPKVPVLDKAALAFPDTPEGTQAMKESLDRIAAARASKRQSVRTARVARYGAPTSRTMSSWRTSKCRYSLRTVVTTSSIRHRTPRSLRPAFPSPGSPSSRVAMPSCTSRPRSSARR